MTLIRTLLLCYASITVAIAQDLKPLSPLPADSVIRLGTPNSLIASYPNLEYINASVGGGFSDVFIRSMGNPLITVDGIPHSTNIYGTTPFREFFPTPQPLAFDIANVHPQVYLSKNIIVSGISVNSIDLKTTDISGVDDSLSFFVNNFSSALYQEPDARGYSIVNNAGFQLRRGKFASRLSVNNSLMDNYVSNMGLQRYGVNAKMQLNATKNLRLTGYLDYSKHTDLKRTESDLESDNSFFYLKADFVGRRIDFRATTSGSQRGDNLFRKIDEVFSGNAGGSTTIYTQDVNYQSNGSFKEVSMSIKPFRNADPENSLELGWRSRKIKEPSRIEDMAVRNNTLEYANVLLMRPEIHDQKFYGSLRFKRGIFSAMYSVDISEMSGQAIGASTKTDTSYTNHFGNVNVELFHKPDLWLQSINFSLRGGWINRCVLRPVLGTPGRPSTWVNPQPVKNFEIAIHFTADSRRFNGLVRTYLLRADEYLSRFKISESSPLEYIGATINVGQVDRVGLETVWSSQLIEHRKIKWLLRATLSWNKISLEPIVDNWKNDHAANRFVSLYSALKLGSFELQLNYLHKDGFEIFRDDYGPTGDGVLAYLPLEGGYIAHVDAAGKPVLESPRPFDKIHTVKFDIIENMKLTYTINGLWKRGELSIGLHYNQMRALYSYMNDIIEYRTLHRSQVPSFYHVLSASIGIKF